MSHDLGLDRDEVGVDALELVGGLLDAVREVVLEGFELLDLLLLLLDVLLELLPGAPSRRPARHRGRSLAPRGRGHADQPDHRAGRGGGMRRAGGRAAVAGMPIRWSGSIRWRMSRSRVRSAGLSRRRCHRAVLTPCSPRPFGRHGVRAMPPVVRRPRWHVSETTRLRGMIRVKSRRQACPGRCPVRWSPHGAARSTRSRAEGPPTARRG